VGGCAPFGKAGLVKWKVFTSTGKGLMNKKSTALRRPVLRLGSRMEPLARVFYQGPLPKNAASNDRL
jgi:hypothetical protein